MRRFYISLLLPPCCLIYTCSFVLWINKSAEHHLHVHPKSPSTGASITPHSVTFPLSSSFPLMDHHNFCYLRIFSFLHVGNISENKICLHADISPSWTMVASLSPLTLGIILLHTTSSPADYQEVSLHGILSLFMGSWSLKSKSSFPFCNQRTSQWLSSSLLGEGIRLNRQWMSGVSVAPLFDIGDTYIGTVY